MVDSISRSPVRNRDPRKPGTGTIDDEIAALLAAIEKETVPSQLQDLAVQLQAALVRKKAQEPASGGSVAELSGS